MKRLSQTGLGFVLLLAFVLAFAAPAFAVQILTPADQTNGYISLPKEAVIDDDVVIFANEAVIDGTVNGDLFVFARRVTVGGVVYGDLFSAAQEVTLAGQVRDDARLAGENVVIKGQVDRNLAGAASRLILDPEGKIGRNVLAASQSFQLAGTLEGDLQGVFETLDIQGTLGGHGKVEVGRLTVGPKGLVQGGMAYTSREEAVIAPGGQILGSVERTTPMFQEDPQQKVQDNLREASLAGKMLTGLLTILTGLLVWFLWRTFLPYSLDRWSRTIAEKPGKSFLLGFALLVTLPIAAILAMITVIGFPLGVLALIGYGLALYLSKLVVAQVLGEEIFRRWGWKSWEKWAFPVGLTLVVLLSYIPYVGFFVKAAIYMVGLGSAGLAIYQAKNPPSAF